MCGIVGYIGKKNSTPFIIKGLKNLEYRGYDSAGIVVFNGKEYAHLKAVGKLENLEKKLQNQKLEGYIGIGHTRWATHGGVTEENAHPHADCKKQIWVVHNGIIENYDSLRRKLQNLGHKFSSETDTEVFAHLLEEYLKKMRLSRLRPEEIFEGAILAALKEVEGSYAFAIVSSFEPDKIFAARKGSPLAIGIGNGENYLGSDFMAFSGKAKKVAYLNDYDFAVISKDKVRIKNLKNLKIKTKALKIDLGLAKASKGKFPHFMIKEIFESPAVIQNATLGRLKKDRVKLGGIEQYSEKFKEINQIYIIACGTSYYAGLLGKYIFEEKLRIPTFVEQASEFRYRDPVMDKKTLAIFISQSGETADTLAALSLAKQKGALTLGIVNVIGSTIARETDCGVYNYAGPEIAVASTKAFISQITILSLIMLFLGGLRGALSKKEISEIIKEIKKLPFSAKKILKEKVNIKKIAQKYKKYKNFLYLGRKYNFATALEGALKLKEVSYIHAEGYCAGEMKHGPIAMIDQNFPCIFIVPHDDVFEKVVSNIEEIKARNGKVIIVTDKKSPRTEKLSKDVIVVPKTLDFLSPVLHVIPLQLFAYYVCTGLGRDVDKPRNLAKSVTVE